MGSRSGKLKKEFEGSPGCQHTTGTEQMALQEICNTAPFIERQKWSVLIPIVLCKRVL